MEEEDEEEQVEEEGALSTAVLEEQCWNLLRRRTDKDSASRLVGPEPADHSCLTLPRCH